MNYVGGGLLSGNLVLTLVPVTMFGLLVFLRVGKEEQVLEEQFGPRYVEYMKRTGNLLPRIGLLQ